MYTENVLVVYIGLYTTEIAPQNLRCRPTELDIELDLPQSQYIWLPSILEYKPDLDYKPGV